MERKTSIEIYDGKRRNSTLPGFIVKTKAVNHKRIGGDEVLNSSRAVRSQIIAMSIAWKTEFLGPRSRERELWKLLNVIDRTKKQIFVKYGARPWAQRRPSVKKRK